MTKLTRVPKDAKITPRSSSVEPVSLQSVLVFDLGGTWFRSGILTDTKDVVAKRKTPAINYVDYSKLSVSVLQKKMVEYLIEETHRLLAFARGSIRAAGVSVGAAIDGRTGRILNAGPLWGPNSQPFALAEALCNSEPHIEWCIVNDVTAALLRYVHEADLEGLSRVALITVSSGIAARTFDVETARIPLDRIAGLQGEIGHVPTVFDFHGMSYGLACDCGGSNHLNAFSSGRGIVQVIRRLAHADAPRFRTADWWQGDSMCTDNELIVRFSEAIHRREPLAVAILDATIAPLARTILTMLATDPLLERIALSGGVVHGMAPYYLSRLREMLREFGIYQIDVLEPNVFDTLLVSDANDDLSGLIGAGIAVFSSNLHSRHYR